MVVEKGCSLCQHSSYNAAGWPGLGQDLSCPHSSWYPPCGTLGPMAQVQGLFWSQLWGVLPPCSGHHLPAATRVDWWPRPTLELKKFTGDVTVVDGRRQKGEDTQQGGQEPHAALISPPVHPVTSRTVPWGPTFSQDALLTLKSAPCSQGTLWDWTAPWGTSCCTPSSLLVPLLTWG